MTTRRSGQAALLVVRVWVEHDGDGLRARVTETLDLEGRDETVSVASSVEEIVAAVRSWLEVFLAGQ